MIVDILISILINATPILILLVPLLFFYKKPIGKLYFRIFIGICVFYLIYWVLPLIFQEGSEPNELTLAENQEGDFVFGMGYIFSHVFSLIIIFISYPFITLPFIFFLAPIISFLITWNRLRKEKGTIEENLKEVTYEYKESPLGMIRNGLMKGNWKREKEILKLMIVLLPISLYLLQVVLDISNLQTLSLTTGETALGWFLEILFVYLATFIFSIELIFSSKIAIKGRYFGEDLREQIYKSLYQVGAPVSLLSIILFVIQYTASIFVIIYFFAYFIMASIIFVLFLDIFEPLSILILIKTINWVKNKKTEPKMSEKIEIVYGIVFGFIAFIIYYSIISLLTFLVVIPNFGQDGSPELIALINSGNFANENPSLFSALKYDLYLTYGISSTVIIPVIIFAIMYAVCMKYINSFFSALIGFIPWVILLSLLFLGAEEWWFTGQLSITDVFGSFRFYTFRTASFEANLFTEEGWSLLWILSIPYIYSRYIINIIIWSLIVFYIGKDFKTRTLSIDEKNVKKVYYSEIVYFFKFENYMEGKIKNLISKNEEGNLENIEQEREEIQDLIRKLETDKIVSDLMPIEEDEKKRFYFTLKYLFTNNLIRIWKPEFSLVFEKVEKQGLYVMYTDGRDVFNYRFTEDKEGQTDPALISGMFSAITSFIAETTQSSQVLKTIDHGDITIMIEYGRYIFSALFIKGSQTSDVRAKLKDFVSQFEDKHKDILSDWNGALNPFENDHLLVDEIFVEE